MCTDICHDLTAQCTHMGNIQLTSKKGVAKFAQYSIQLLRSRCQVNAKEEPTNAGMTKIQSKSTVGGWQHGAWHNKGPKQNKTAQQCQVTWVSHAGCNKYRTLVEVGVKPQNTSLNAQTHSQANVKQISQPSS